MFYAVFYEKMFGKFYGCSQQMEKISQLNLIEQNTIKINNSNLLKVNPIKQSLSLDNRHTEIIKNPRLEHLLRPPPHQSLLFQNFPIVIFPRIMGVEDQKLTFPQLPVIVHSDNGVRVLAATVHDGASGCQEVLFELLAFLEDLLAVRDVQDLAGDLGGGYGGHQPGDLRCADPCGAAFQFAAAVELVQFLLDFSDGVHLWHWLRVALDIQPTYQGLQGSIGAAPAIVSEALVSVVIVLVHALYCDKFVLVFFCYLSMDVRVEYFGGMGSWAVQKCWHVRWFYFSQCLLSTFQLNFLFDYILDFGSNIFYLDFALTGKQKCMLFKIGLKFLDASLFLCSEIKG